MGTNATIVISNRRPGQDPEVLAGLYAQFDGGVMMTGMALVAALDKVVLVPGDFLRNLKRDGGELTAEQHAEVLAWRAAYGGGIPTLIIARLFNAVDGITPGAWYDMGDGPVQAASWRYSHNAFLLETPERIDLDNCVYRYFVEPRTPEQGWWIAGQPVCFPRPWLKAMYGNDEVIFEGWPEDAPAVFDDWHRRTFADAG